MIKRILAALKFIFLLFCAITTIQLLFGVVVHFHLMGYTTMSYRFLQQSLILAMASSLPTLVLIQRDNASLLESRIRKVIHFLLTLAAVVLLPIHFTWSNRFIIIIVFVVIYLAASFIWELQSKRLADKINKRIVEINKKMVSN